MELPEWRAGLNHAAGPTEIKRKRVKLPSRQTHSLTPGKVSHLLGAVDSVSPDHTKRNRAVIAFLYGTGRRSTEALSLSEDKVEDDFDGTPHKIRVIGKGNKALSLFPTAQRVLKEWLGDC